ncbi:MAG: hypothetical protein II943_05020 [Victivallales bacterium]|nr:hypothetical protein [Victivallales bacterium]
MAKKNANPRLFLISGDDEPAIHAEAERLFLKLAGEEPDPFATEVVSEDDRGPRGELVGKVISAIRTPPFLGGRKTIWLKHFTGFGQEAGTRVKNDPMELKLLAEELARELPEEVYVLLDGPDCDPAKPLAKACAAQGETVWKNRPNTMRKGWREDMKGCLAAVAREKGVTLSYEVSDLLVDVLGADTSLINGELEKLICYAGAGQPITPEAVREMCPPYSDQENWGLTDPVGKRDLAASLSMVEMLLARSKEPAVVARQLLTSLARTFLQNLSIRLYMAENRLKSSMDLKNHVEGLDAARKRELSGGDAPWASQNAWRIKFAADAALSYRPEELMEAIRILRDALLDSTTTGVPTAVALENALLKILPKTGGYAR